MTATFPRQPLPPVRAAAGGYCTPDPDQPHVMTAWKVDKAGGLHRFPPDQRWEPRCPRFAEIPAGTERQEARNAWYRAVYYPWKTAIVEQISADPAGAAAAFARQYPRQLALDALAAREKAQRERQQRLDDERRHAEALLAAALAGRGRSVPGVAKILGIARSTTRERIAAGRPAWEADPVAARAVLVAHHAAVIDRADAEDLVERLLTGPVLVRGVVTRGEPVADE